MIVVMRPGATPAEIEHMIQRVESLGLKAHVIVGTERTVIAAVGEERRGRIKESLEGGAGVDKVLPILAPYKMASSEIKKDRTLVRAGSLAVGGLSVAVIAGPCSVESEEQIITTAQAVKAAGATAL